MATSFYFFVIFPHRCCFLDHDGKFKAEEASLLTFMFKHQLGLELMFFFVPSSESIICLNGQKIATKEMDLECERVTKSQGKENDGPTPRESEKDKVR